MLGISIILSIVCQKLPNIIIIIVIIIINFLHKACSPAQLLVLAACNEKTRPIRQGSNFCSAVAESDVTMSVAVLLVMVVCLEGAASQLLYASATDPPTTDANPAIIAEPENTTNVTLFCHVVRDTTGTRFNVWRITKRF